MTEKQESQGSYGNRSHNPLRTAQMLLAVSYGKLTHGKLDAYCYNQ